MEMPILRPLPIPTKGVNAFKRAWRWFTVIRKWEVVEDYFFWFKGHHFFIPKGFVFDGASIPRVFWSVLSPTGLLLIPGLFHDYGYRWNYLWEMLPDGPAKYMPGAGKGFWDKLFLQIGEQVNGVHFANGVAWLALKVGGWGAWYSKRKAPVGCPAFEDRGEVVE